MSRAMPGHPRARETQVTGHPAFYLLGPPPWPECRDGGEDTRPQRLLESLALPPSAGPACKSALCPPPSPPRTPRGLGAPGTPPAASHPPEPLRVRSAPNSTRSTSSIRGTPSRVAGGSASSLWRAKARLLERHPEAPPPRPPGTRECACGGDRVIAHVIGLRWGHSGSGPSPRKRRHADTGRRRQTPEPCGHKPRDTWGHQQLDRLSPRAFRESGSRPHLDSNF